jgi:hypothetical protein
MKNYLFPLVCVLFLFTGCVEKNYYETLEPDVIKDSVGLKVTNVPFEILTFSEAKALPKGTLLKLRINRTASEVLEYTVTFDGTYEMAGERLIFCTTPEKLIVGAGDSGSPLLTEDGKVVGALCYGFSFANNQFAARAIEDMTTINTIAAISSESGKKISSLFKEMDLVWYVNGMDKNRLNKYHGNKASALYGENTQFYKLQPIQKKSASIATVDTVIPGNSIAVMLVSGDLFSMGAIGTLSYIKSDHKVLAFGHSFGALPISARTVLANMVTMINSGEEAFKVAVPSTSVIGSLIKDTETGVVIDPAVIPQEFAHSLVMNLTGTTALEYGSQITLNHTIANFQDPDQDISLVCDVAASAVNSKLLSIQDRSLTIECSFTVNFKNLPAFSDVITVSSSSGVDSDVYYGLMDDIDNYLYYNEYASDNIAGFTITMNVSDFDGTYY